MRTNPYSRRRLTDLGSAVHRLALLPLLSVQETFSPAASRGATTAADRRGSLRAAVGWLCLAHEVTGRRGCSQGFSLLQGWRPAYPETTGYIIGTLLAYSRLTRDDSLVGTARQLGDWELELQAPDGGIPEGLANRREVPTLVFDTGMVLHGWLDLYEQGAGESYLAAAARSGRFLVRHQSDDGAWRGQHSYRGIPHTYHSRASWALLRLGAATGDQMCTSAALRNLRWVLSMQAPNGWFEACSFLPGKLPNTHGMAYTLRGLTEAYASTGDSRFLQAAARTSRRLMAKMARIGTVPAVFDQSWEPVVSYVCLTGLVQLGGVWLRLYQLTQDRSFEHMGSLAVDQAVRRQRRLSWPPLNGALGGSFPLWGRYAPLQYPNWAAKFLADSLMLRSECAGGEPDA